MNAFARTTALALITSLTLSAASSTEAAPPVATLIAPPQQDSCYLPKFGFSSYNLSGVGEVVTHVRWGGLAWKMGLQKGDIVRSLNHIELGYHGAWNDALRYAMNNGGQVHLHIIDRNTGLVAQREVNFGGYGNYGTPHVVSYNSTPNTSYLINNGGGQCHDDHFGYPSGPITQKSVIGPQKTFKKQNSPKGQVSLNDIVKMFDKD